MIYSLKLLAVFVVPVAASAVYHLTYSQLKDGATYLIGMLGTTHLSAIFALTAAYLLALDEPDNTIVRGSFIYLVTLGPLIQLVGAMWIRNNRDKKGEARTAYLVSVIFLWLVWGIVLVLAITILILLAVLVVILMIALSFGAFTFN